MAQVAARKTISEAKEILNGSFSQGQSVKWIIGNNSYSGKVLGKWSNFGLVVLFDGSKNSTIINLMSDKIEVLGDL